MFVFYTYLYSLSFKTGNYLQPFIGDLTQSCRSAASVLCKGEGDVRKWKTYVKYWQVQANGILRQSEQLQEKLQQKPTTL